MIRKVKFSNFYSFEGEQEINFLAKKKETYDYFQSKSGDYITKVASFIGGNASGKTNVMRFFSFLGYFVCRKIDDENESSFLPSIAYRTFFNNNKVSKFYVEFEKDNSIFFYDFSIKNDVLLKESLYIKKIQKGTRKIEIFSRELNVIKILNGDYFENISIDSFPKIREDISLITFIKKSTYSVDVINSVYDYFARFRTNINEKGEINNKAYQLKMLLLYLEDNNLKKEMENFISHFDIGLSGFEIKKEIKEKGMSISVQGVHTTKEKNNKLDFNYESRGTQALFFTMANILSALKNNSVVVIDEIESGFHPEALNKLISYFIDKNEKGNAQIIFSSHSLGFINKLDMHQIYLAEKDDKSRSFVYRLNQVENIRSDENFLSKYMTGAYGAFPKIRV